MNNLIKNFYIGDRIIFKNNLIVEVLSYIGTVPCLTGNGVADMQLYSILYNNQEYYASDTGLCVKDPNIFNRVIANIGYRGSIAYKSFEKEYTIWKNMLYRCYWPNNNLYPYYGALGIIVDPRWHCFEFFLYDLINMRSYDTFKESKRMYDMDLSKHRDGQLMSNCYGPGRATLRPLASSDVAEALSKAKSMGAEAASGTYIDSAIVHQPRAQPTDTIVYDPMPNGRYPYKAYEQMLSNAPNLPIPSNDDIGYNNIRILNGVIKCNAPLIKPTTTAYGYNPNEVEN